VVVAQTVQEAFFRLNRAIKGSRKLRFAFTLAPADNSSRKLPDRCGGLSRGFDFRNHLPIVGCHAKEFWLERNNSSRSDIDSFSEIASANFRPF
jgi:hypothetical protein